LVDEKNFSVVGENLTFDFPTKYGEEINSTWKRKTHQLLCFRYW
jgi:hypothetical protein